MLDHNSLLFSPTRDAIPSSDDNFSANDILAAQLALESEAKTVLPFSFNTCTHQLGPLKQAIYACKTCLNDIGICAACSIACHSNHDLVELFNRRDFTCDCGTSRGGAGSKCNIDKRVDGPSNPDNKYDANFKGTFCYCGRPYDPHTDAGDMYQCLVCEDWNHHDCVFGTSPSLATNDSTTPPPLSPTEFDSFICHKCVTSNIPLRRILDDWAGAEGRGVIIIDDNKALGKLEEEDEEEATISPAEEAAGSSKRGGEDIAKPTAKRARLSSGQLLSHSSSPPASSLQLPPSSPPPTSSSIPCFLPGLSTSILGRIEKEGGRCNVFLAEDYHIGWCQCEVCKPLFYNFPYLIEEEEVYEPPLDNDLDKSGLELGLDALNKMPRAAAISAATAFSGLSERLKVYLQPFSARGETISKEAVDDFFRSERERNSAE